MRMPQAYLNASATKTEAKRKLEAATETTKPTQVKARIDMSAEVAGVGNCPECRQPMVRMTANGHPVFTCMQDRITLPIQDEANDSAQQVGPEAVS